MPFDRNSGGWEAIHDQIIDQVGDFIAIFDATTGRITEANRALCQCLGYEPAFLLGRRITEIVPGFTCETQATAAGTDAGDQHLLSRTRYECLRSDGASVPVEVAARVISTGNGPVGLFTARDISENKRMEEMLLQAQKLEAIGTLAGGIAHDFNNILFPIIGYSEMLMDGLPQDGPHRGHVEKILHAAERARKLVRQILSFSRPDEHHKRPMKIQPVIAEGLKLLRPTLPATIEIRQDIDPACGPIMADPTQIHQVFVNLCTNAYHAMRSGGVLGISLKESIGEIIGSAVSKTLAPGRYVCLSVTDSGHGMDGTTMSRIFEPYFTTKAKGQGTGLGLSVIHGIIVSNGGDIRVASTPGKGSQFMAYFPCIDTAVEKPAETPQQHLHGGNEHILLVEDDEMLIQLEEQMLERLGYRVTAFSDSTAALAYMASHAADVDVVLTDMTMPKLNGAEFAARCLTLRSDLPVVLCTGYSDIMDATQAAAMGIAAFIGKPVKIKDMAETLRSVLDGRGAH